MEQPGVDGLAAPLQLGTVIYTDVSPHLPFPQLPEPTATPVSTTSRQQLDAALAANPALLQDIRRAMAAIDTSFLYVFSMSPWPSRLPPVCRA